jgi:2,5-diketo-D-gluconate reductase A
LVQSVPCRAVQFFARETDQGRGEVRLPILSVVSMGTRVPLRNKLNDVRFAEDRLDHANKRRKQVCGVSRMTFQLAGGCDWRQRRRNRFTAAGPWEGYRTRPYGGAAARWACQGWFVPSNHRAYTPTATTSRSQQEVEKKMSAVPTITFNDGKTIPQLGFGVFQIPPDQTAAAVRSALDVGYRHIDTAEMYGNEKEVGQGIRDAGLDRGEVFITSKLNNGYHRPDDARRAFDATLSALGSDYVDLFLIHWPLPTRYDGDFVSTWNVLQAFAKDGRALSIGVSNFQVAHLDRLAEGSQTVPAVNQIEVHPYFTNEHVRAYDREHGIATEAWSPIAQGQVLDDQVITRIANAHSKTPAQIVLRWHIQRGDVVFPKSVQPDRIKSNFEIFDFGLDSDEMNAITGLDRGESGRTGPNPDEFDYIPD